MKVDFSKFSYNKLESYKKIKQLYDKNVAVTKPSFQAKCHKTITKATQNATNTYNITSDDVNIAGINCSQSKYNKRKVKDYIREFLKNDRNFTVLYEKHKEKETTKDLTVVLIPSRKSKWDYITITLDAKVPETECKEMVNNLINKKITNTDSLDFKNEILDFFKNK